MCGTKKVSRLIVVIAVRKKKPVNISGRAL